MDVTWRPRAERRAARRSSRGQSMVEYALILALVALVAIVVLAGMGKKVNNSIDSVHQGLTGQGATCPAACTNTDPQCTSYCQNNNAGHCVAYCDGNNNAVCTSNCWGNNNVACTSACHGTNNPVCTSGCSTSGLPRSSPRPWAAMLTARRPSPRRGGG